MDKSKSHTTAKIIFRCSFQPFADLELDQADEPEQGRLTVSPQTGLCGARHAVKGRSVYTCVCVTGSLYRRKLTEHCKPAIMEKIKIRKFKKKNVSVFLLNSAYESNDVLPPKGEFLSADY